MPDLSFENSSSTHLSTPSSPPSLLLSISQTPTPTSAYVSSSIITTLKPYILPKSETTHQLSILTSFSSITNTVPSYFHPRPRPSITTNHLPLSILFGPRRWNKYFHVPAHDPYSVNTFQFKKCIQKQMGRITFHTQPDRSRLIVIVDTESQVEAMLTVKDLDRKPFPVSSVIQLNTHWYCSRTP